MNSFTDRQDQQALEDYLYDLICEVKRPEETDLLVEVLLTIQQPHGTTREELMAVTPIDRARIRK